MAKTKKNQISSDSLVPVVQKGDKVLRQISKEIPLNKIKSPEIQKVISDMNNVMESQIDAVAIAAVQIGVPVRLFIISHRAFEIEEKIKDKRKNDSKTNMVFINPKIINQSKKKQLVEEGCLSVRYIYGEVSRAEKTTIEAYDENGNKFSRGFSGFLSQIVQHESDHLNGGLFIDRAKNTVELTKEEYEKSVADMK